MSDAPCFPVHEREGSFAAMAPREASPSPSASAPATRRKIERAHGYVVRVEGEEGEVARCGELRGFYVASRALADPRAPAPLSLVLLAPEGERWDAFERWAEDAEQARRRVTLERCSDGREILVIATLYAYGRGVEPVLAVESITAPQARGAPDRPSSTDLTRSGVHRKIDVAQILACLGERSADED
ncbi:MAG: hypothetical protein U0359_15675 [Byssovorax sp.]